MYVFSGRRCMVVTDVLISGLCGGGDGCFGSAGRVVSVMPCRSCRIGDNKLVCIEEALDGTAYATVGNLFSLILECRKLWSSVRACEAAGNMGAKIHELLMNTYRSSIVAFLVYFQSSYAGLIGPLSCVSHFSNFTQETFQFRQGVTWRSCGSRGPVRKAHARPWGFLRS